MYLHFLYLYYYLMEMYLRFEETSTDPDPYMLLSSSHLLHIVVFVFDGDVFAF